MCFANRPNGDLAFSALNAVTYALLAEQCRGRVNELICPFSFLEVGALIDALWLSNAIAGSSRRDTCGPFAESPSIFHATFSTQPCNTARL